MNELFLKKDGVDYICNFYRYKLYSKNPNNYLITLDDGQFLFLNSPSFLQLKKGIIKEINLFNLFLSKGLVVTSVNFNSIVKRMKKKYSYLQNGTSLHIVIPTHRCNLNCVYCFASATCIDENKESDMTIDTAKKVVEFIMKSPSNAITIEFQGGEPTVKFDIIQVIVKYAVELNKKYNKDLRFALVSNLTLMTINMANWLIDNDVSICTSFDGPVEVHDKNRFILSKQGKEVGTYDTVVSWVKKINEIYKEKNIKRQVNALPTISVYSLPYYKEIIDEYVKHNMSSINIRPLTFLGRVKDNNSLNVSYTKDQFITFFENSLKYINELKLKGVRVDERIIELYEAKVIENKEMYHTEYNSPCGATIGQITYFTNGKIYTCNEALNRDEFCIGDVFNDSWQDIFKKKETSKAILNSMLEQNVMCDRCAYKPYCATCMVENFSRDNKFNFYPTKTHKHFETIYHCNKIFDRVLEGIKLK